MKDMYSCIRIAHILDAKNITNHTDIGSDYIDLAGWESATAFVNFGALTNQDANNWVIPVLQSCDSAPGTNVSWAAVPAADINGAFAAVNSASTDQCTQAVGYKGSKRYLRILLDFTSAGANPDNCNVSAGVILCAARHGVASDQSLTIGTSTA